MENHSIQTMRMQNGRMETRLNGYAIRNKRLIRREEY